MSLVAAVREEQWQASTPCAEWNVRQLVNHQVAGNQVFAHVLEGAAPSLDEVRRRVGTEVLGEDAVAAYRASAATLLTAFGQPGALQQMVTVPVGTVPRCRSSAPTDRRGPRPRLGSRPSDQWPSGRPIPT